MKKRKLTDLFDHQKSAIDSMLKYPQLAVFIDAGLGKTATSLVGVKRLKERGYGRVLVICPKAIMLNVWRQEAEQWSYTSDLTFSVLHGTKKNDRFRDDTDIHITNFESMHWLADKLRPLKRCPYDILIIDESSKLKSAKTQRFKKFKGLFKRFQRRYILSATPMPNEVADIWSQWFILDQGETFSSRFYSFQEGYYYKVKQIKQGVWLYAPKPDAEDRVKEAIAPRAIRMKAEDHKSMPDIVYNTINVDLAKNVLKNYKELEKEFILELQGGTIVAKNAAVKLFKLQQIVQGAVHDDAGSPVHMHDEKSLQLKEIVYGTNKPVLAAINYHFDVDIIRETFKYSVPVINSTTTDAETTDLIKRWNNKQIPLLLCNPKSIGHGVNLQHGSNILVWYTLTFSGESYVQMNARLYRTGQEETVIIHHLVCSKTVDEYILQTLQKKGANQEAVLAHLKESIK